ncbi:very short patch repair endonuclease [Neorhizobium sp. SOG26]|uniref:very short patch repair endonuclease n=1 Tax=Neorhizobium sp. SOG26 TaxID=2060726 RepID=UPI001FE1F7F3|nr:very short patch repair endonuclease [Neorhizobium sp. SOG26]
MSRIRSTNTKPEMVLRRGLHALGLRYRLHVHGMPGKPDLVFSRKRTAVFVHGCFWHGHRCHLFKQPKTQTSFWMDKISKNTQRDQAVISALINQSWRVLIVWECSVRGKQRFSTESVIDRCRRFIMQEEPPYHEISSLDATSIL